MNNSEHEFTPEADMHDVDARLIFSISRIDALIDGYIIDSIGMEAYGSSVTQQQLTEQIDENLDNETRELLAQMTQEEIDVLAAEKGMQYLDDGYDMDDAQTYGQVEAIHEVGSNDIMRDHVYLDAFSDATRRVASIFDQQLSGRAVLESFGERVTVTRPLEEGVELLVMFAVHGKEMIKVATLEFSGEDSDRHDLVRLDLAECKYVVGDVDINQLERAVLDALNKTIVILTADTNN